MKKSYKYLILSTLLIASTAVIVVGRGKEKTKAPKVTFETMVLNAKTDALTKLDVVSMPVVTEVIKAKAAPKSLKVDVSGWKELILTSWGTLDGTSNDFGVWINPRLTTKEGTVVLLDGLTPRYNSSNPKPSAVNLNLRGQNITVNGQKYEHALFQHSDGEMAFVLDKKYISFEAEVAIDGSASNKASVVFGVQNVSGLDLVNKLEMIYPNELAEFKKTLPIPVSMWLTSKENTPLKQTLEGKVKMLKDKTYFASALSALDKTEPITQSMEYITLLKRVNAVVDCQPDLEWLNINAIRLSLDDMKKNPAFNTSKYEIKFGELKAQYPIAVKSLYNGDADGPEKVAKLVELKREILLANPLLDMDKIVVAQYNLGDRDRSSMVQNLGMPNANYVSMYSAGRTNRDAQIVELSNIRASIKDIKKRTIYKPERKVNIADLQMHWNGDKLLFSSIDENDKWQVYEVGVDGTGFKKKVVLDEPDIEFCDANYLPDGRIVSSTNIGYNGVPCVNGQDVVGNLSIYDPTNGDFRRLTFDQEGNWNPVVMNNGRLMYTRWEYTDLTHYFSRIVMHMNPDGTENRALYGSGSFFPNATFDMKPLPSSPTRFVGIISGHHGTPRSGRLIIFDPAKSRKEEKGMVQEIPFRDRPIIPIIKDELVDGVWPQFVRPYPLNDEYFLVSAKLTPESLWGIYLVDVFDNLTLIAQYEGEGLNAPLAVRSTKVPPIIPDRVDLKDSMATIFIQNLYEGEGTVGVAHGAIKALRVFTYEYAYINSPADHDGMGIQSGWDIKTLLGTVPVEADGSVIFKVPANRPISLQPLDENGAAIQWFRSWFTAMPGETVSCVGCHEDLNKIAISRRVTASLKKPSELTPNEGGMRPFSYELEIQPILDRACLACHNGSQEGIPDFTPGIYDTMRRGVVTRMVRPLSRSYLALHPHVYRQGPEADMYVLKPYEYHVSNSELVRMLNKGHHNVQLTDKEMRTIYNWIDFNAPFFGSFDVITELKGYDQYERRMELMQKYSNLHNDWRQQLKDYASYLDGKGKVTPVMPKQEEKRSSTKATVAGWPMTKQQAVQKQVADHKADRTVEIAPGISMEFVWIPAGSFVMGSDMGDPDNSPQFATKIEKGFWMSECEVTNEQYNVIYPDHDSRVMGQFWKDHTTAGYPANKPLQPVIRISWDSAMKYCEELGKISGLKVKLPTETQWEWACRAGSNTPMWYGGLDDDFGKLENMADTTLTKMAVTGVDPRPMSAKDPLRKFWDFMPKIALVNDGAMIQTEVGKYLPNPWGLKDMHGNVAEWTSSDYVPYPLKAGVTSQKKVVRGGSWTDRPIYSASYSRKMFLPWQTPYNVGFRVIIEE